MVNTALTVGQVVVNHAHTVASRQAHTRRKQRITAIVLVPVCIINVRHASTKTALIQAVAVLLRVKRCLTVLRSHDDLKQEFYHKPCNKPVGLPALAALSRFRAERRRAQVRRGHTQHCQLRTASGWSLLVVTCHQCRTAATTELLVIADDRAKLVIRSVHHRSVHPTDAASGNPAAVTVADGSVERHGLHRLAALVEDVRVEAVPAPHTLTLTAVQGSGAAVSIARRVRRVKLALLAVIRHQIAAKTQLRGKLAQRLNAAVPATSRRSAVAVCPVAACYRVSRLFHCILQVHAAGLPRLILHLEGHVL